MAKTTWGRKETIIWPQHMPIYTYGLALAIAALAFVAICIRIHLAAPLQARIGGNHPAETTGQFLAAKFEHDTARFAYVSISRASPDAHVYTISTRTDLTAAVVRSSYSFADRGSGSSSAMFAIDRCCLDVARPTARFHFTEKKMLLTGYIKTGQNVGSTFLRLQCLDFQRKDLLQIA
jgi:hypothetical protein